MIEVSSPTIIGSVMVIASTFIGLVVWLVKSSFSRQTAITERMFNVFEERHKNDTREREAQLTALNQISESLKQLQAQNGCRYPTAN